jgi:transcriptional regulator with XRE-family HTH domain
MALDARAVVESCAVRLVAKRVPQREIARRFGIAQSGVSLIKRGQSWKHVPGTELGKGKLTENQIAEVFELLRLGRSQESIGKQFGVTQSAISWLKRNKGGVSPWLPSA